MNFKTIIDKKNKKRYISIIFIVIFWFFYLFTGSVVTEWHNLKYIQIASYFFMTYNLILLLIMNYEIIKINKKEDKWGIILVGLTFVFITIIYIIPVGNISQNGDNYYGIYKFNWSWLTWWAKLIIYLGVSSLYFCLLINKTIGIKKIISIILISWIAVVGLKAMNQFMLSSNYGWSSVLFLIIIVVCNDSFAFIGGSLYGKRKFAPFISPNKTIEGAITGLLFGWIISVTYSSLLLSTYSNHPVFTFNNSLPSATQYLIYVLLGFVLSVFSQLGDLLFSFIKRCYRVKDFSNLIPGHGGLLDRADSLLTVFFVMFIICSIVSPNN